VLSAVAPCSIRVINKLSSGRDLSPRIVLAISKCPLEEMGRNSVIPWIIPRRIAVIKSIKLFF
jgi:hypothetical protein